MKTCQHCSKSYKEIYSIKKRKCLKCSKMFLSNHKMNRICNACKNILEWRSDEPYNIDRNIKIRGK